MLRERYIFWARLTVLFAASLLMVTSVSVFRPTVYAQGVVAANDVTILSPAAPEAAALLNREIEAYWTPERRATAIVKDVGLPNTGISPVAASASTGQPGFAGGYDPATKKVGPTQTL